MIVQMLVVCYPNDVTLKFQALHFDDSRDSKMASKCRNHLTLINYISERCQNLLVLPLRRQSAGNSRNHSRHKWTSNFAVWDY